MATYGAFGMRLLWIHHDNTASRRTKMLPAYKDLLSATLYNHDLESLVDVTRQSDLRLGNSQQFNASLIRHTPIMQILVLAAHASGF